MNEEETKVEETVEEETTVENTTVEETTEEAKGEVASVEENTVEAAEGTEKKAGLDVAALVKKNVKWIALAVAALILIIMIASCASGKDRYTRTVDLGDRYVQADKDLLVNMNGGEVSTDEEISSVSYSADNSLTVVKTYEDTLYVVKDGKAVEVDEDIDSFKISFYGDTIAYMKAVENHIGELFLYNVEKEEAVKIDPEAYEENYVLSPNGKAVAYIGNCEVEMDAWWGYTKVISGDLFVSKNGKDAEKLYKDAAPIAVSDNAKYVYYYEDVQNKDGKFCVNGEKILSSISDIEKMFFNDDMSELLYEEEDNTRYYRASKKNDVKVKGSGLSSVLLPENTLISSFADGNASYVGIDTFNETVLSLESGYYYMYGKGEEAEKVTSYAYSMQISEDGKGLLFVESGNLVYIKDVTKSREETVLAEELEISNLKASRDLKKIYYLDYEGELFFLKKNGKSVSISDDVTGYVYSDKFGGVYYVEDEELFYATTSAKSRKSIADDVVIVFRNGDYVMYSMEEGTLEYSTYILTGKDKSRLFFE